MWHGHALVKRADTSNVLSGVHHALPKCAAWHAKLLQEDLECLGSKAAVQPALMRVQLCSFHPKAFQRTRACHSYTPARIAKAHSTQTSKAAAHKPACHPSARGFANPGTLNPRAPQAWRTDLGTGAATGPQRPPSPCGRSCGASPYADAQTAAQTDHHDRASWAGPLGEQQHDKHGTRTSSITTGPAVYTVR